MEAKLLLTLELEKLKDHGYDDLRALGFQTIEVSNHDIFLNGEGNYYKYIELDNPRIAYETNLFEVEGDRDFTVDEYYEWLAENKGVVEEFQAERAMAVMTIAGIIRSIEADVESALKLAKAYGLPFELQIDGQSFDVRKAHAVDWDSSSMYC